MLASPKNCPKHSYLLVFAPCVVRPTLTQRWSVTEYDREVMVWDLQDLVIKDISAFALVSWIMCSEVTIVRTQEAL